MPERRNLPLDGLRVIDLGQVYQGPYCGYLLAQAGAEVIKVEPLQGEPIRIRSEVSRGSAVPFAMLNGNKRAITLNLKSEDGREILKKLAASADVLLENYAPGVMDRLGVGWEVLSELNPRLVYATGSGYGIDGPDRDKQAMDITIQAVSGMMSVTGFPDGPPVKCGPAVVDFLSGTHLYAGIMTALYERTVTGRGRLVEVSMQETVYPSLASNLGMIYDTQKPPPRVGNRHGGLASCPYNVYPCSDGFIAIICTNEKHWSNLTEAMGRPELRDDPRFATRAARASNMDLTDGQIAAWSSQHTRDEAMAILSRTKVPSSPVRDLIEVTDDPHMHARGALIRETHPEFGDIVVPASPIRIHGTDPIQRVPAPRLGEHNRQLLTEELGYSAEDVDRMEEEGAIGRPAIARAAE